MGKFNVWGKGPKVHDDHGVDLEASSMNRAKDLCGLRSYTQQKIKDVESKHPKMYKTAKWVAGVASSILFVADVYTDGLVAAELHRKGHYWWFRASVGIIGLQYGAATLGIWFYLYRVNNLRTTLDHFIYAVFAIVAIPVLDALMVLYSFVPWWAEDVKEMVPTKLQEFLPSYHASRMVSEACFESILQTLLQGYIFFKEKGGGSLGLDAATVGRSVGISAISLLKNFVELWVAASLLGHSIGRHIMQLASMGAGLPFNAIMRGDIEEYGASGIMLVTAQVKALMAACNTEGSKVKSLTLWRNNIGAEGTKAIGEALKVNGSLTTLYLTVNGIGAEGAKAIADALKVNGSLTSLYLWDNDIGDEGAKAIGEGLKVNGSLTSINLTGNNIGAEGGKAIAEALKVNGSLTTLNLHDDNIGDEGAKAIAEALEVNGSLTSLDLETNNLGNAA
eukprot:CAMPEP_0182913694 /NCGR_PEP_ID=MMETSP0034_2-20130328/38172_1 /TAXON_ID=156128 /ORGANISM="Nephroselmis pyriformis, Strain CCMP717" /LENGTH=448 /DNA_ID=CAMNT_0025050423 /DNA_START=286 /DNA_END=1628 /DNA_ORIENTATION=+